MLPFSFGSDAILSGAHRGNVSTTFSPDLARRFRNHAERVGGSSSTVVIVFDDVERPIEFPRPCRRFFVPEWRYHGEPAVASIGTTRDRLQRIDRDLSESSYRTDVFFHFVP